MAKNLTISLLAIVLITSMCLGLAGCNTEYGNMPLKYEYGVDNSIARLTGDKTGDALMGNPDRGFSINAYMTLDETNGFKTSYAFPASCQHEEHMENGLSMTADKYLSNQFKKYEAYDPQVVVMTVFLTNYVDKELSNNAIGQILDMVRGFKSNYNATNLVLRFAYQHVNSDKIPDINMVLKHMKSIGTLISNNGKTISGIVSAIRISFAGIDGNFENVPYNENDTKLLIDGFAQLLPTKVAIHSQAPNVGIKNRIANYQSRISMGFYNDHVDGSVNTYISGGTNKRAEDYKQYVYQSEINYNSLAVAPNMNNIDGKEVLKVLKDGYFSTMDIENITAHFPDADSVVDKWKTTFISKKDLNALNLPYYDEWFMNSEGQSQNRSVYDYLRDFMGYNLSVTNFKITKQYKVDPKDDKKKLYSTISFVLTNYGMAAPLHIDGFKMYIKNNATGGYISGGDGISYKTTYDPKLLVSGGQIKFEQLVKGDIDVAAGNNIDSTKGHSIGLMIYTDHSGRPQYVRLNNDITYSNNINWIYSTK